MSKYNYDICEEEDGPKISEIMESINKEIDTEVIFVKDSKDFIDRHISEEGFIVKTTVKGVIIAFLIVRFPEKSSDNLGRDVDIEEEDLHRVAHIESLAVVPKHRGQHLGGKMISFADKVIKNRGYQYSMATVSPKNKYSLINFLKRDYEVIRIKRKYSGVKRLIMLKKHKRKA